MKTGTTVIEVEMITGEKKAIAISDKFMVKKANVKHCGGCEHLRIDGETVMCEKSGVKMPLKKCFRFLFDEHYRPIGRVKITPEELVCVYESALRFSNERREATPEEKQNEGE